MPDFLATFSKVSSRLGLWALLIFRPEALTLGKHGTEKTNPRLELHTDDSSSDKGDNGDKHMQIPSLLELQISIFMLLDELQ